MKKKIVAAVLAGVLALTGIVPFIRKEDANENAKRIHR